MRKAKKVIVSQIFFLITISLIANKSFFSHIHILPDGNIIVHAHPYFKKKQANKSKQSNHTHTNFTFYLIDQSNRFDDVPIVTQQFNFKPELQVISIIILEHLLIFDSYFTKFIDNRGPPVAFV